MTRTRPARTALATCAAALTLALTSACTAGGSSDDGAGSAQRDGQVGELVAPDSPTRYVALGDSFTAAPFVPESVDAEGCYRSTGNYPARVAAALDVDDFVDVSCSGADTTHMTRPQVTATGQRVPAQLDALTEETDLVTVGIGGNDFDVYGTMTRRCPQVASRAPQGSPCRTEMRRGGEDVLLAAVGRTQRRVRAVLGEVRERSPEARVLLVTYPQLAPSQGTCRMLPLAEGDYAYSNEVARRLDRALRTAAERAGVEVVDLWSPSDGHDICSEEPWVNGAVTDFSQALEYHPFARGQEAAADLVLETWESGAS